MCVCLCTSYMCVDIYVIHVYTSMIALNVCMLVLQLEMNVSMVITISMFIQYAYVYL